MRVESEVLEQVTEARAALEQARQLLERPSPKALEDCGPPLAGAAEALRKLKTRVDAPPPGHAVVRDLQQDLEEVRGLLEQAGAFYLGWSRILESAAGTYDAGGGWQVPAGRSLSVSG
jgi:hypothetical protein